MSEQEIQEIQRSALALTAKVEALETLCLAIFGLLPNREEVAARYAKDAESYSVGTLHDGEMRDAVVQAFEEAHARLGALVTHACSSAGSR